MNRWKYVAVLAVWMACSSNALAYDLDEVRGKLTRQMTVSDDSGQDVEARMHTVERFVDDLKAVDDYGLGDPRLFAGDADPKRRAQARAELAKLQDEVTSLVERYRKDVRPLLINNVALKRDDKAARHNKGELALLFFPTKQNHRTGKMISGICSYKTDISNSFFDEQITEAGLTVNFPGIMDEPWLHEAMNMEAELLVFLRMHREYLDGIKYDKVSKTTETVLDVKVSRESPRSKLKSPLLRVTEMDTEQVERGLSLYTVDNPDQYSLHERDQLVHSFVSALKSLDDSQSQQGFRQALEAITRTYQQTVKPILVANVRHMRNDPAAQKNKGDVLSLFFRKRHNHFTGKPVTGKLVHQEDQRDSIFGDAKMVEVGILAEHPELKQERFIQDALLMEAELVILSLQHKKYMDQPASIF